MNLSMKWLKEYVDMEQVGLKQYIDDMTMAGNKVEHCQKEGSQIQHVVVGEICEIQKHPHADKLVVCTINIGQAQPIQIVTGATNVTAGCLVPVALDGAVLADGTSIRQQKLRNVLSQGMLCSLAELGLSIHDFPEAVEDGIFLLDASCEIGKEVCQQIGYDDTTVVFEITSNRPDCMSVVGLAIETAALYQLPLRLNQPTIHRSAGNIHDYLSVQVEQPALCPRYTAKVIRNVTIAPSPQWMRARLRASGVRPVNNLVDITNYVMLEYGQPLHAFDLRHVQGDQIVVRCAKQGEHIVTLDGVARALAENMLVIADADKAVAVAGIMGGEHSGIRQDTTTVVFESACFDGASIRGTAKALGMRTDACARYGKGLSPHSTLTCAQRACELVELLGAGEVVDGTIDWDASDSDPTVVPFDPAWINRLLGIDLERKRMIEILEKLLFTVNQDTIAVPQFRTDIAGKADIAEEVARFYGYNNIPTTVPKGLAHGVVTPKQRLERKLGQTLRALGCDEIMTYSFISPNCYDQIGVPQHSALRHPIRIMNPLGDTTSVMRNTMIPSMLETLSRNHRNRNAVAWLYEVGTEYHPVEGQPLPDEKSVLMIGIYGDGADFYTIKGIVEDIFCALGIQDLAFAADTQHASFHPGRTATVSKQGTVLGLLGEVVSHVAQCYDMTTRVYLARIELDGLFARVPHEISYRPLPKFPAMQRDLSLVCDKHLPVAHIEQVIKQSVGERLEKLELFDVYQGAQIEAYQKSVCYALTLRSGTETMTDQEADDIVKKLLQQLVDIEVALRQ